jgi:hypothetical protein
MCVVHPKEENVHEKIIQSALEREFSACRVVG